MSARDTIIELTYPWGTTRIDTEGCDGREEVRAFARQHLADDSQGTPATSARIQRASAEGWVTVEELDGPDAEWRHVP